MPHTTDPIADLLTRIRNANSAEHESLQVAASRIKVEIVRILHSEGYIKQFETIAQKPQSQIKIVLKYGPKREHVITDLKRVSKPGLRVYCGKNRVPRVLRGLGIAIISTSRGVMTDREARRRGVGGEVLCHVW